MSTDLHTFHDGTRFVIGWRFSIVTYPQAQKVTTKISSLMKSNQDGTWLLIEFCPPNNQENLSYNGLTT